MKKFFAKIGAWWQKHKPTKRRLIQLYAVLLTNANFKGFFTGKIYTGNTKYACVPGLHCYSCPGSVGACPMGALQNALAASNTRTPAYVIGIILLFGLLLGRTICGFLCPFGLLQDLTYKIRSLKLKKSKVTRILSYLKYIILVAFAVVIPLMYANVLPVPGFCKYLCPAGTLGGAIMLLMHPDNAELYAMLGPLFTWKFAVMCVILVASVFIYRVFCRFLCPLGALYGFFNKLALLGVKIDENKCTDCGLCVARCKMDVKKVGDHECINCGECISVCPTNAIRFKGSKLFVHANAASAGVADEDVRPLDGLLNKSAQGGEAVLSVNVAPVVEEQPIVVEVEPVQAVKKPKDRAFWLRVAAWGTALLVLLGAILYYNVFDKTDEVPAKLYEVGEVCPDFTLDVFGGEEGETFTLSDYAGKVVVVNFWYTTCTPCVGELPEFEELAKNYAEDVVVVAIQGKDFIHEDINAFLETKGWTEWSVIFMQDTVEADVRSKLFTGRAYPTTAILDGTGKIVEKFQGRATYDELQAVITPLLGE